MDINVTIDIDSSDQNYTNNIYVVNIDIKNPVTGENIKRIYKLR